MHNKREEEDDDVYREKERFREKKVGIYIRNEGERRFRGPNMWRGKKDKRGIY